MRILGIDVSSTTIGWCILDTNDKDILFVKASYHKPSKTGTLTERIAETRDTFSAIMNEYKPDVIAIEDIIQFMKGKSTAKTIIMLTTFNRAICLAAHDFLGHSPTLFNVMSIRHGIKPNKTLPKKEDIPAIVAAKLGIQFPYEFNKKGAIKVESYDMADGVAVALHQAQVLIAPKKSKVVKTKNLQLI